MKKLKLIVCFSLCFLAAAVLFYGCSPDDNDGEGDGGEDNGGNGGPVQEKEEGAEEAQGAVNPPNPPAAPDTVTPIPEPLSGRTAASDITPYLPIGDVGSVSLPEPSNENIPQWRGFNKLNLYDYDYPNEHYDDGGLIFRESDFALMNQLGFNFVRLPIDYRYLYNTEDKTLNMDKIHWLDVAVEYAVKYNIHIELNLHKAPGFWVGGEFDGMDILQPGGPAAEHFVLIWQALARRYKNIPNSIMDFNLLNEPTAGFLEQDGVTPVRAYRELLVNAINAIREERPDRLIVIDTDRRQPLDLGSLGISVDNIYQAPHCYAPFSVTHEGMMGGSQFPENFTDKQVTWPIENYFNGFIYGPWHSRQLFGVQNTRAVFNNPEGFDAGTVSVTAVRQSQNNTLVLLCDGSQTAVLTVPADMPSGSTLYFPDNAVPAGTKKAEIYISSGDWINIDKYVISGITVNCTNIDWGYPPSEMTVGVDTITGAQSIKDWFLPPVWDNIPVIIGEMGCMAVNAGQAQYRARLMGDYADALGDLPWAFWEFKGGAMSMFRLTQSDVCTTPYSVSYGGGRTQIYYIDELWYDAIRHKLRWSAEF
jgi:endoglucanase